MRLAIIPARGGSKRIPQKNIREFSGKPIIAWSIEAALESGCFEDVIVSTDSPDIADTAKNWGASVPFVRPSALADDLTGTVPVIRHAIELLGAKGESIDKACCIYATAPLIDPDDIKRGLELLTANDCDYAVSTTSFPFPIQRALRITSDGRAVMMHPEHLDSRSQDLMECYHDAGQFYWGYADAWLDARCLFGRRTVPVLVPRYRVQDIDTMEDWKRAEVMFQAIKASKG